MTRCFVGLGLLHWLSYRGWSVVILVNLAMSLFVLLPLDTSFTGRTDIWTFAVQALQLRPWTGYGFAAFWGSGSIRDLPLICGPIKVDNPPVTTTSGFVRISNVKRCKRPSTRDI